MLADECPGTTCYGIPLVRPPNSGRAKDPRKVCSRSVIPAIEKDVLSLHYRNVLHVAQSM
jgi:hypothetical protein